MSLFGSIQIARGALRAQQIGLQVVGQNIANANTPGYVREELLLTPNVTQAVGNLRLGLGVRAQGVVQKIDRFLEERLRNASGERASAEIQEQTASQLEQLLGELTDTDLSTSLDNFINSIHEVLNQPESVSVRNLAVLAGQRLAGDVGRLSARTVELQSARNSEIQQSVGEINQRIAEVGKLNVQIAGVEAGDVTSSDAVGLRDQRSAALAKLAELIGVRTEEQPDGSVNVYSGGDFLVFGDITRDVVAVPAGDDTGRFTLRIADTNGPVDSGTGRLAGLYAARDEILGGFLGLLDRFSGVLANEFNKLFTQGQGLHGYQEITSQESVSSPTAALDAAGLPFTPVNGSLQVVVLDRRTNVSRRTDIAVDLNGLDGDSSLTSLASALNAVDGITAEVTSAGRLKIRSDDPSLEFAFSQDTSGVLASLGVATFFTGSRASDLGVNEAVRTDPARFAASNSGIGAGTGNAVLLAGFLDRPLESAGGATLAQVYDQLTSQAAESASGTKAVAEGLRTFENSLNSQHLAITGVNLDEEAIRMLSFQRAYQAAAKLISTTNELLNVLMNL